MGPLLTSAVHAALQEARAAGQPSVELSLDLQRSRTEVQLSAHAWHWRQQPFPYLEACKDRTIYYWDESAFVPAARFTHSLIKLVPTPWGAPTFEIDGIKMLPSAQVSPYADAQRKVALIAPRGKRVLDCCGGLGYFAAACLQGAAAQVCSYEINADVLWLRSLNPWSPDNRWVREAPACLTLLRADVIEQIGQLPERSVDAILHDPPRIGIAGELYSQAFYVQLERVLSERGRLFHYTGTPNKLTSGRDVPREVAERLRRVGFSVTAEGDGLLAVKRARTPRSR